MAEKINMPSGMGGLVRYFDDYKSKLNISPTVVVGLVVVVIIIEYLLHNL